MIPLYGSDLSKKKSYIKKFNGDIGTLIAEIYDVRNTHVRECVNYLFAMKKPQLWDSEIRTIVTSPATPDHILNKIYSHKVNVSLCASFIRNPNTPTNVLNKIWSRKHKNLFVLFAANQKTPKEILVELYALNNNQIDFALIQNYSTPSNILHSISQKQPMTAVNAHHFASNPNTPEDILISLVHNEDLGNYGFKSVALTKLFKHNFFGDWPQDWVEAKYGIKLVALSAKNR